MPLTKDQVNQFITRAKAAGHSDDEIANEIKRKREEDSGTPSAKMDVSNPDFAGSDPVNAPVKKDKTLLESIGSGAIGLAKNLLHPFKGVAADSIDAGNFFFNGGEKAFSNGYHNPLRSEEELKQTRNQDNLGGFALDQAKNTAGILSNAVPFGKAGFIGSKAIVPGAIAGAANEFSQEDSTPESILGAAATGGITGGVLQAGGKIINAIRGVKPLADKGATALDEGTRQIRQKASVFGAKQEKAINATLDKYKIKGSPQAQYEQLEPTMQTIEGNIEKIVKDNPDTKITVKEIKDSFMDNLKSSLRSKDMTAKQAQTEVAGYLKDLLKASGGTGKVGSLDLGALRSLKKLVNEDYGRVNDILETGGTLTPRQKVIHIAWESLDNAVKTASPEMKTLLLDESNLYKSAQSISKARSNQPTLRAAGFSIPQVASQKGREILSGSLKKTGNATEAVSSAIPNISPTLAGQVGVRSAVGAVKQTQNEPSNENNTENPINQDFSVDTPPVDSTTNKAETPDTATGTSVQEWLRAKSRAADAGDKQAVAAITAKIALEQEYQKTLNTGKGKPLSGVNAKDLNKAQTATKALGRIEAALKADPNVLVKKVNSLNQSGRQIGSDITSAIDLLGYFRTGASITPSQRADYVYMFPSVLDDAKTKARKIATLKEEFKGYADGLQGATSIDPDELEKALGGFSN